MSGKKQNTYFMFSFFQSTWGMGIFEYMEKQMQKAFKSFFI